MGVIELVFKLYRSTLSNKQLKRNFLTDCIVDVVTCYIIRMTRACVPMIERNICVIPLSKDSTVRNLKWQPCLLSHLRSDGVKKEFRGRNHHYYSFSKFVRSVLPIILHFFVLGFASLDVVYYGIRDNVSDGYEWREFISVMTNVSVSLQSANY